MTVYVLGNDILFGSPPATMRAGKVISDAVYNVAQLQAAGALLFPQGNPAVAARALALQKADKRGQHGFLVDEGKRVDQVGDFTNSAANPRNVVLVTVGGNSPYAMGVLDDVEFQLSALGLGVNGGVAKLPANPTAGDVHLFRALNGDPTLHPCTIQGNGTNIEDPNNVGAGSYLANVTLRAVALLLRFDGTNWIYAGS